MPRNAMSQATKCFAAGWVVVVGYPTPSEGWGHGGRPWSPRSRATPQGWVVRLQTCIRGVANHILLITVIAIVHTTYGRGREDFSASFKKEIR